MTLIIFLVLAFLPAMFAQKDKEISVDGVGSSKPHEMVVYWGQQWQNVLPLEHFCLNSSYDKIVLSFVQIFFDKNNKDHYPQISFASGCEGPVAEGYPSLKRCKAIERGINVCQQRGITVTLALGGYIGDYGFRDEKEIRLLAARIWNLFLNGKLDHHLRPFGEAVLDGIDLNIERGGSYGYAGLVGELHRYMSQDPTKQYIITSPPGCPYPDIRLGPDGPNNKNTALTLQGDKFSDIYIQFYCCGCDPGNAMFWTRFNQWTAYANDVRAKHGGRGPRIFIGLPAHPKASGIEGGEKYFKSVEEIRNIYEVAKSNPGFGGFMMWNAGFDDLTRDPSDGLTYGDRLVAMLRGQ